MFGCPSLWNQFFFKLIFFKGSTVIRSIQKQYHVFQVIIKKHVAGIVNFVRWKEHLKEAGEATQLHLRPKTPRVQVREQILNYTRSSHRGQNPTSSPPSLPSSSFQWKPALWVRSEAAVSDHSSVSSFGLDSRMNLICLADSWQVSQDWTHGHITRGPFELRSQRESNDRILRTVWRGNWLARRGEKEAAERSSARGRERFSTKVK